MQKAKTIINKLKKKWKLILVITIVLSFTLFLVIRSRTKNDIKLKFSNPKRESITKTIEISGHTDAKQKARLRFIVGGKVVYLGAQEGDSIKKWQTIATIDKALLNKTLQKNLNNYMKERWNWENVRDDIKDKSLTTTERRSVDKSQWDLNNSVIDVEIQDISIKNNAIYSPFAGILTHSPTTTAGVQLLASDYFEIVDPNSLIFRAAIDESDVALIKKGQKATLTLDSFPNKPISTTVSYISYTSTETSSGTAFIIEFPLKETTNEQKLRIGMNGDIDIILETKDNVLTIPTIAIIQKNNDTFVNVKTGQNTFEERKITTGLETDEAIEVTKGLTESDEVLIPE